MKRTLYFCILLTLTIKALAQNVNITPGGITPAIILNNHPRLSYDGILALPAPKQGDLAYDSTFKCLRIYTEGKWLCTYQNPLEYSPNIIEAASAGGPGDDSGTTIAVDAPGNMYVAGGYSGTASFDAITKTSLGLDDIFVAKYNKNGILQWVQAAGGAGKDSVHAIAVDGGGNVYITGFYNGSATFNTTTITSLGGTDIFLAKYDASGAFQWAKSAGGTGSDVGSGIAIDGSNNIYVVGSYAGSATFGTHNKTSAGLSDIFLAKYDTNGTAVWVESAGGTNDDYGQAIALDASGKIHITGHFKGSADFGSINKIANASYFDIFVAKYDPTGLNWTDAQSAGGTNHDYSQSIAVDVSGNVYVTGNFQGTFTFGAGSSVAYSPDMFVIKFNSTGTPQWIQSAGGNYFDTGRGIAVDKSGNIFVTGFYSLGGTSSGFIKISLGLNDSFIVSYNANGDLLGVKSIAWTGDEIAKNITADSKGNIYATGHFTNAIYFDKKLKTSQGGTDMFVIRLDR
jgi:hypothetical protein